MLEAVNLCKTYNGHDALKGINLVVRPGEIYCLLGANGAGKSTTINIFLNFIRPTSGQALVNALDVTREPLRTKKMLAYIPENLTLYPSLTGMENLRFFCRLSGKDYSKSELEKLLMDAGLQKDFLHRKLSVYSKGMRQKVGIALAVAKDVRVLLLDEPTSGLDPKASNEFSALLLRLKEKQIAVLMATHDLFRAKETGTHIGIMKNGSLMESFNSRDVSFTDLENIYLQHMHD